MKHEVPNRRDDVNDFEDYDQEDGELPDLPTFSATEFDSDSEQVEENIDFVEEKEEVPMKDIEMDENHNIDYSGTEEALQWSFAEDHFIVVMELNDQSSFLLHTIPSFISNELRVKNWKLRFEHSAKSGGLLASISGLLSGRRVTCEYLRSELEGKWNWIDPRAIEVVCLVFD
ncbi:hypothetical protein Tco_1144530 [Tanacetum coccineum]